MNLNETEAQEQDLLKTLYNLNSEETYINCDLDCANCKKDKPIQEFVVKHPTEDKYKVSILCKECRIVVGEQLERVKAVLL